MNINPVNLNNVESIIIKKNNDNDFRIFDPKFKEPNRRALQPLLNWLTSMDILNNIPEDNQCYDLIEYLKEIRDNYKEDSFTLKQIDRVINF